MSLEPETPARSDALRVVVITYNPGSSLTDFVTTLRASTMISVEVVAADNGSIDGSPERAAADGTVNLLQMGENLGYGSAANRGIAADLAEPNLLHGTGTMRITSEQKADPSEYFIVANPDLTWTPGSLDQLLAAALRHPTAGVLGPAIATLDGERYPSARAFPSLGIGFGHAVLGRIWPTNPWTVAYHRGRQEPTEGPTGWLSGAAMLIRREAFEAIGGFDEGYFMFFEDVDLCHRMKEAGWERIYVPSATVKHIGGGSWRGKRNSKAMVKVHHASAARYLCARYNRWYHLPLRAGLRIGLGIRSAFAKG